MDKGKQIKKTCYVLGIVAGVITFLVLLMLGEVAIGIIGTILMIGVCAIIGEFYEQLGVSDELKNKGVIMSENHAIHKEGLQGVGQVFCKVCIRENDVYIVAPNLEFSVAYDKIFNAISTQNYETIQTMKTKIKNKGTLGKALVGGALLGVPGAIIGAAGSSTGKATTTVNNKQVVGKSYLAINYTNKEGNMSTIVFESGGYNQFITLENEINTRLPIKGDVNADGTIEL